MVMEMKRRGVIRIVPARRDRILAGFWRKNEKAWPGEMRCGELKSPPTTK